MADVKSADRIMSTLKTNLNFKQLNNSIVMDSQIENINHIYLIEIIEQQINQTEPEKKQSLILNSSLSIIQYIVLYKYHRYIV